MAQGQRWSCSLPGPLGSSPGVGRRGHTHPGIPSVSQGECRLGRHLFRSHCSLRGLRGGGPLHFTGSARIRFLSPTLQCWRDVTVPLPVTKLLIAGSSSPPFTPVSEAWHSSARCCHVSGVFLSGFPVECSWSAHLTLSSLARGPALGLGGQRGQLMLWSRKL